MPKLFNIPLADYQSGDFTVPQFAIPDATNTLSVTLARSTTASPAMWPNASTGLHVALEFSTDGGASWQPGGEATDSGGIRIFRGIEQVNSVCRFSYPPGTNRLGRGTLTITNGPLRTQGSVDSQ